MCCQVILLLGLGNTLRNNGVDLTSSCCGVKNEGEGNWGEIAGQSQQKESLLGR